jgi:hypothetical protein
LVTPKYPARWVDISVLQKPNTRQRTVIFFLMFSSFFTVQFVGSLILVELVFLVLFLAHGMNGRLRIVARYLKPFSTLLVIAIAGQLVVDFVHSTPADMTLKGFSLILFTSVNLCTIAILTSFDKTASQVALIGYALGGLAGFLFQPNTYARSEIWKFGIGYPLTLILFCLLSVPKFQKYKRLSLGVVLFVSSVSLLQGARSLGLLTFISALFFTLRHKTSTQKQVSTLKVFVILFASTMVFATIYNNLASDGSLGVKAQSKYISQTSVGSNIIVNSRTELVFTGRAIADSPILGFGSYAIMTPELQSKIINFLSTNEISFDMAPLIRNYGDRIPVHSMILQWWLFFGILGVCFPLYLLIFYLKSFKFSKYDPLCYYLALSGIWNVLFSPYGEAYRLLVPLTLVHLLATQRENYSNGKNLESK